LGSCEVTDFKLTEGVYPAGLKTPYHSHEHALLCFVIRGAYADICRREVRTRQPSTVFFLPPGEEHLSDFRQTGVQIFRVEINPQRLERIREYSTILDYPADFDGGELPRLATKLYVEFRQCDKTSPLAIEGLVLEMIAAASRRSIRAAAGQAPGWLNQAREMIHDGFAEKLSLAEIAQAVGAHPIYLASEFRRRYHSTVGEYVRQLRVESACRALSLTDDALAEIALQAGFADQSHFCKVFRRLTGLTPSQYRAAFRARDEQPTSVDTGGLRGRKENRRPS
jgi:AraC family transcriptional regulator